MFKFMSTIYLCIILGVPTLLAAFPILLAQGILGRAFGILAFPFLYLALFLLVCGGLSIPYHSAIKPGKFERRLDNPQYRRRRMYGLCWTCVYYSGLPYYVYLTVPLLRRVLFRLFGYKGQMDFTVYPDSWIRDLPLLDIGEGAYIGNKCTLGTNMALSDGTLLAGRIKLGKRSVVGHLAIVGFHSELEDDTEVGLGCLYGMGSKLKKGARMGPGSVLAHGAVVRENANLGHMCYVGNGVRIGAGVWVPPGAVIPAKVSVKTQKEADGFARFEVSLLNAAHEEGLISAGVDEKSEPNGSSCRGNGHG